MPAEPAARPVDIAAAWAPDPDPNVSALHVFAVAPLTLGGVCLRSPAGPERDAWLAASRQLLPPDAPWRRMPAHIGDEALLGGLDLSATLTAGRPVMQRGLLAQARGGIVLATMAERVSASLASRVAHALDGAGSMLADASHAPAAFAVVALDEGRTDDECVPTALADRLALHVTLGHGRKVDQASGIATADVMAAIAQARTRWKQVQVDDALVQALVAAGMALGVASLRATWQALCALRVVAALGGRHTATADDAALAASLVLATRATRLPPPQEQADAQQAESPPPASSAPPSSPPPPAHGPDQTPGTADSTQTDVPHTNRQPHHGSPLEERVVEAARAAIPPSLLALLTAGRAADRGRAEIGRSGQSTASRQRGRPVGAARGVPGGGARLALVDTLRAAAPWQPLRRRVATEAAAQTAANPAANPAADASASTAGAPTGKSAAMNLDAAAVSRVFVTRDDLRIQKRVQRRATTTIFAIDASGSQAQYRLAEAKGAVELLLADCYARRDRVAVIGFRGQGAQILLGPTRSLVRAKRQLAGLPGGGGTPLANAIDAAATMAAQVRRANATPLVVLLTDGRANVCRQGQPGREKAMSDALLSARALAATRTSVLLIDTSQHPGTAAQTLALALQARCLALPHAEAQTLSTEVRQERGRAAPHRG
jgi:magnesium chelatase subunit D